VQRGAEQKKNENRVKKPNETRDGISGDKRTERKAR